MLHAEPQFAARWSLNSPTENLLRGEVYAPFEAIARHEKLGILTVFLMLFNNNINMVPRPRYRVVGSSVQLVSRMAISRTTQAIVPTKKMRAGGKPALVG